MENTNTDFIKESKEVVILRPSNLSKVAQSDKTIKTGLIPHWSLDEMKELLKRVPPNKYGMFFQVAWRTGVRITELLNIRKKDIDFDNNTIQIRWLKSRKYKYRLIPLHLTLKNPLYMFCANLKFEDLLFGFTRQNADYVCKKYGFGNAHKIRHSYAINFLRQSKSPMAIVELQKLLGHSNIQTTMEYLKVVPLHLQESVERINFD